MKQPRSHNGGDKDPEGEVEHLFRIDPCPLGFPHRKANPNHEAYGQHHPIGMDAEPKKMDEDRMHCVILLRMTLLCGIHCALYDAAMVRSARQSLQLRGDSFSIYKHPR